MERRLAAILAADVVGYSRLIRVDEEGTLLALRALRKELINPKIEEHRGRIVKLMGDGILVEFASVVDAVACSAEVQHGMVERNTSTPETEQIVFRVGINLGDVVIDGEDIQGDGVNVAARLEALSEPGGMCISDAVHEQVRDRLDLSFEDLGNQLVKNIERPVRVWSWSATSFDAVLQNSTDRTPLPLPDKPSIAVLPFTNMSGDQEQEYFADGISEDIITALAKFHSFLVIARNSSFIFKGRAVDVKDVARDLGVRYVVEGSVRKAGSRVRVTAQMIDVESGGHIWADRYDRELDDIFVVQDEITQNISAAIGPEFESAEIRRSSRPGVQELTVWDLVMQGRWHLGTYTKEGCDKAKTLLSKALELDDRNAQAYALLAMCYWMQSIYRWSDSVKQSSAKALEAAQKAVAHDSGDANAHSALGSALTLHGQHDHAIQALTHAIQLNPNLASAHGWLGLAYTMACDFELAVECVNHAITLSPRDIDKPFWSAAFSFSALAAREYDETVEIATGMLRDKPDLPTALRHRAAALAWLGRVEEARKDIDRLMQLAPDTTLNQVKAVFSLRDPDIEAHWLEGLRRAGMPE